MNRLNSDASGARSCGFTLVELAIVLAVLAVLVAAGMPPFGAALARHRLQAAAHHLQADLSLARQEAVAHGQSAHLSLQPGAQWCWALSLGAAVDCRQATPGAFNGGQVLKVVHADAHPNTTLAEAEARQPFGMLVKPDHVAGLAAYLLGPASGVMTGSLIDFDQNVSGAYPE